MDAYGSLTNGGYQLVIDAARVTSFGLPLDGNQDDQAGGDFTFGDESIDRFFRKYGDQNGDNSVSLVDFAQFRQTFGKAAGDAGYLDPFDTNGNAMIDLSDFAQFRNNFGS